MASPSALQRTLLRMLALVGVVYVAFGAVMYSVQDRIVFPATWLHTEQDASVAPDGVEVITLPHGTPLWVEGEHDRIVLMVHGNGEWVGNLHTGYGAPLDALKFSFAAVEMRGVAGTAGPVREEPMVADVVEAVEALVERGWERDRIIVHGRSIGGGIASQAVARTEVAGLVLESSFDSLIAVARRKLPAALYPSFMVRTKLRSDVALDGLDLPVLQVHDIYDDVVGVARARALREHLVNPTVVETAFHAHGAPIVLTDERAHLEWRRWLNRVVPRTDDAPLEIPVEARRPLGH